MVFFGLSLLGLPTVVQPSSNGPDEKTSFERDGVLIMMFETASVRSSSSDGVVMSVSASVVSVSASVPEHAEELLFAVSVVAVGVSAPFSLQIRPFCNKRL